MKTLLLRLSPFVLSLFFGMVIFIFAEIKITHKGLNNLIIGIASGLLSIPMIFICYEFVKNFSNKSINNSILEHIIFEINYIIIDVLKDLKDISGFKDDINQDNITDFFLLKKRLNKKELILSPVVAEEFESNKRKLLDIMYNDNNIMGAFYSPFFIACLH